MLKIVIIITLDDMRLRPYCTERDEVILSEPSIFKAFE